MAHKEFMEAQGPTLTGLIACVTSDHLAESATLVQKLCPNSERFTFFIRTLIRTDV